MAAEKTDALVIRIADFSETSRVVTFFTREWGKVATVAKGGRRLKGPFDVALDLLTVSRIVFLRKSSASLDILTEAKLLSRFRPNPKSLVSLYGGYYIAELLDGLSEEYDPHPVWYDEAVDTLSRLSGDGGAEMAILRFELTSLREIGQLPAFDECLECGQPLTGAGPFTFAVSQGGLVCRACRKEEYKGIQLQGGTVAILQRLCRQRSGFDGRLAVSPRQLAEMRHVVTAAIAEALGRRPKILRYLQFST